MKMPPTSVFKMCPVSTIIILGITFLFCVRTTLGNSTEVRRCHWCGPLAEQIHRSRRAASCDPVTLETQVTDCEPGYNYCAIVATSPPFYESRYCVKLYQDECHSVYCPTTEIWKMTCPCKGDLCNSNKTEREDEAFNSLKKITRTTPKPKGRNKKVFKRDADVVTTTAPVMESDEAITSPCDQVDNLDETVKSTIVTNVDNDVGENIEKKNTKDCELNNDKPQLEIVPDIGGNNQLDDATKTEDALNNENIINEINSEQSVTTPATKIEETLKPIDDNKPNEEVTEITSNPSTVESIVKSTMDKEYGVTEEQKEQFVSENKLDDNPSTIEVRPTMDKEIGVTEEQKEQTISENKLDDNTEAPGSLITIEVTPTMGTQIENQVTEVHAEDNSASNSMEESKLQIENQVSENHKEPNNEEKPSEMKPNEEQPTAEALQDNATPAPVESTKPPMTETTLLTTLKEIVSTAKPKKNSAFRSTNNVYSFFINVCYLMYV